MTPSQLMTFPSQSMRYPLGFTLFPFLSSSRPVFFSFLIMIKSPFISQLNSPMISSSSNGGISFSLYSGNLCISHFYRLPSTSSSTSSSCSIKFTTFLTILAPNIGSSSALSVSWLYLIMCLQFISFAKV